MTQKLEEKELWKKIDGYDYYEVSNLGRIISITRIEKIYNYKKWESFTDIYKELGLKWSNISKCCNKKEKLLMVIYGNMVVI